VGQSEFLSKILLIPGVAARDMCFYNGRRALGLDTPEMIAQALQQSGANASAPFIAVALTAYATLRDEE